jgi:hypothetical protein
MSLLPVLPTLLRHAGREQRDQSVAGVLKDVAAVCLDDLAHLRKQRRAHPSGHYSWASGKGLVHRRSRSIVGPGAGRMRSTSEGMCRYEVCLDFVPAFPRRPGCKD